MITREDARDIVASYLAEEERTHAEIVEQRKALTPKEREILGLGESDEPLELVVQDDLTIDCDFGWVFFYQSREFIETGEVGASLLGNAPLIVAHDGMLHETGTAQTVDVYIDNFRKFGTPFPPDYT